MTLWVYCNSFVLLSVVFYVTGFPRWSHSSHKCCRTKSISNTATASISGWPIHTSRKAADSSQQSVAISLYKFKEVSIAFPLLPAGAPPHVGDKRIPGVEGAKFYRPQHRAQNILDQNRFYLKHHALFYARTVDFSLATKYPKLKCYEFTE